MRLFCDFLKKTLERNTTGGFLALNRLLIQKKTLYIKHVMSVVRIASKKKSLLKESSDDNDLLFWDSRSQQQIVGMNNGDILRCNVKISTK